MIYMGTKQTPRSHATMFISGRKYLYPEGNVYKMIYMGTKQVPRPHAIHAVSRS